MKTFAADDPRHGTYAGGQQHRKAGEKPCEPCRLAFNAYHRQHRKDNPEALRRSQEASRASSRAAWALVARHFEEYQALYCVELTKQRVTS